MKIQDFPLRLGIAARRLREDLDYNQMDLAERSGLNQGTISRIERGDIAPEKLSLGTAYQLAKGLDMKLSELIALLEDDHKTILEEARSFGAMQG